MLTTNITCLPFTAHRTVTATQTAADIGANIGLGNIYWATPIALRHYRFTSTGNEFSMYEGENATLYYPLITSTGDYRDISEVSEITFVASKADGTPAVIKHLSDTNSQISIGPDLEDQAETPLTSTIYVELAESDTNGCVGLLDHEVAIILDDLRTVVFPEVVGVIETFEVVPSLTWDESTTPPAPRAPVHLNANMKQKLWPDVTTIPTLTNPLVIKSGSDHAFVVTLLDSNKNGINLTAVSEIFWCVFKGRGAILEKCYTNTPATDTITILNPEAGTIVVTLTADETSPLLLGSTTATNSYHHEGRLVFADGTQKVPSNLDGTLRITPTSTWGVSPPDSATPPVSKPVRGAQKQNRTGVLR